MSPKQVRQFTGCMLGALILSIIGITEFDAPWDLILGLPFGVAFGIVVWRPQYTSMEFIPLLAAGIILGLLGYVTIFTWAFLVAVPYGLLVGFFTWDLAQLGRGSAFVRIAFSSAYTLADAAERASESRLPPR